jgi:hypothetical protein
MNGGRRMVELIWLSFPSCAFADILRAIWSKSARLLMPIAAHRRRLRKAPAGLQ